MSATDRRVRWRRTALAVCVAALLAEASGALAFATAYTLQLSRTGWVPATLACSPSRPDPICGLLAGAIGIAFAIDFLALVLGLALLYVAWRLARRSGRARELAILLQVPAAIAALLTYAAYMQVAMSGVILAVNLLALVLIVVLLVIQRTEFTRPYAAGS
jgi:lysylphosphatidylglycerol synthetase-like protein (DUF2156 family)